MNPKPFRLLAIALTVWFSNSSAIPIVDTTTSWDNASYFDWFGVPDSRYFGQTFVPTGSETRLDRITVFIKDCWGFECDSGPQGPINFSVALVPWSGGNPSNDIGPPMASFGTYATTNNGGAGGFEEFEIDLARIPRTPI